MLTTNHQAKMDVPGKGEKPSVVRAYNVHMGGADRVDQQLHGFMTLRNGTKNLHLDS